MAYLDGIDPAAKEIGAVNTIVIRDDQLFGHNTDAPGFIGPLRDKLGDLSGARCAVIGAGGAARSVTWALRANGAEISLFVRDGNRAAELARSRKAEVHELDGASFEDFDIVVNATPLGTKGVRQSESPATADQLRRVRLAYDLVYNPFETRFLSAARQAGCQTLSGVEMLLAQAFEQFKLWTGAEPNEQIMRETVNRALA
jgi:shikimate dehydrogenase